MSQWLDMIIQNKVEPSSFHHVFPWAEAMIDCPHDPIYHAEGDPWIHTKMVVDELINSSEYQKMSPRRQTILRLASWLHDIAKPATTEIYLDENQDKRVRQPRHAPLGADMAYQALIDAQADIGMARDVYALIFWHMRPSFMLYQKNMQHRAIQYSIDAGDGCWNELLTLCRADNRGRISNKPKDNPNKLDLLQIELKNIGGNVCQLINEPWPFKTNRARWKFLSEKNSDPFNNVSDNNYRGRMILLSGLPGSGRNKTIKTRFPNMHVISVDDIRGETNTGWKDKSRQPIQASLQAAGTEMRNKRDFIWNGTGLTRQVREKIINLARIHQYHIQGLSLDIPLNVVKTVNNTSRQPVPDNIMNKLAEKRQPILSSEVDTLASLDMNGNIIEIQSDITEIQNGMTGIAAPVS